MALIIKLPDFWRMPCSEDGGQGASQSGGGGGSDSGHHGQFDPTGLGLGALNAMESVGSTPGWAGASSQGMPGSNSPTGGFFPGLGLAEWANFLASSGVTSPMPGVSIGNSSFGSSLTGGGNYNPSTGINTSGGQGSISVAPTAWSPVSGLPLAPTLEYLQELSKQAKAGISGSGLTPPTPNTFGEWVAKALGLGNTVAAVGSGMTPYGAAVVPGLGVIEGILGLLGFHGTEDIVGSIGNLAAEPFTQIGATLLGNNYITGYDKESDAYTFESPALNQLGARMGIGQATGSATDDFMSNLGNTLSSGIGLASSLGGYNAINSLFGGLGNLPGWIGSGANILGNLTGLDFLNKGADVLGTLTSGEGLSHALLDAIVSGVSGNPSGIWSMLNGLDPTTIENLTTPTAALPPGNPTENGGWIANDGRYYTQIEMQTMTQPANPSGEVAPTSSTRDALLKYLLEILAKQ